MIITNQWYNVKYYNRRYSYESFIKKECSSFFAFLYELKASAMICGTEKNLYGVCPIYCYEFTYNENSKKGLSFQWNDEYSTFIEDDENITAQ